MRNHSWLRAARSRGACRAVSAAPDLSQVPGAAAGAGDTQGPERPSMCPQGHKSMGGTDTNKTHHKHELSRPESHQTSHNWEKHCTRPRTISEMWKFGPRRDEKQGHTITQKQAFWAAWMVVKNPACQSRGLSSISGPGRSPAPGQLLDATTEPVHSSPARAPTC